MALKTKVKIGNVTNLSDARYCAGMGVDWLSFPLQGINPEMFANITGWISGPRFILEIVDESDLKLATDYPVDYLQVSEKLLDSALKTNYQLILQIMPSEWPKISSIVKMHSNRFAFIECLSVESNSEEVLRISGEVSQKIPIYISSGKNDYPFDSILEFPVSGICLNGGAEEKPGIRDYSSLSDVLEKLELQD